MDLSPWGRAAAAAIGILAALVPGTVVAEQWVPLGPAGGVALALVADPQMPTTMYAGTRSGGVLKTTDGGANWAPASPALRDFSVHALAVDPAAPATLYAGTDRQGIWKSRDGGSTWTNVLPTPHNEATMTAIAVDTRDGRNVWAVSDVEGVFRSADGGATWERVLTGLPAQSGFRALAVASGTPHAVYAGGPSLFRSSDGGRTWSDIGTPLAGAGVEAIAVDAANPQTLYVGTGGAGVFRSHDGGTTWQSAAAGPMKGRRVRSLFIDPARGTLWAGLPNDVMASDDGGRSWSVPFRDFNWTTITAFAAGPQGSGSIHAATTRDGVLTSVDGGRTWSGPGRGFATVEVTGVVTAPVALRAVWLSTATHGVYRSDDGGATWRNRSEGMSKRNVKILLADASSRTLYAGTRDGLFVSRDGADRWKQVGGPFPGRTEILALALDPANPATVYARDTVGLHRSADAAETFREMQRAFPEQSHRGLFGLVARGDRADGAIVAVHRELWHNPDGGAFVPCCQAIPPSRVQVLARDASGRTIYAGTRADGVYRSGDGGRTWSEARTGLGRADVQALLVDPENPERVYAAVYRTGVFRTQDGGRQWTQVGGSPPHPDIVALASDPARAGSLLVATNGAGLWRLEPEAPAAPAAGR